MTQEEEVGVRILAARIAESEGKAWGRTPHGTPWETMSAPGVLAFEALPVLLAALDEARRERDAMERQRDESRDLYEKMMVAIHERAGCRRDGAAGILGWIDDAQMALTFHAKAQRMLFSGTRNVAARLRALLEAGS